MTTKSTKNDINEFLLTLSAVDKKLLAQVDSPAETNKFITVGAAVLVTSSTATLSFGYAVFSVSASLIAAVPLGVFWGTSVILTIDRLFLTTTHKKKNIKGWERVTQFVSPLMRIGLASCIGVLTSIPIELGVFRQEIFAIAQDEQKIELRQEISRLNEENKKLSQQLTAINLEQTKDLASVIPERKARAASYEVQKVNLQALVKTNSDSISQKQNQMNNLKTEHLGLLKQMMILEELMNKNPQIRQNIYWLKAMLITLEILPIIAKMSSSYGIYDAKLETNEHTSIHFQQETLKSNQIQIERNFQREQKFQEIVSQKVHAEVVVATLQNLKVVIRDLENSPEFTARQAKLTSAIADRIATSIQNTINETPTPPASPETSPTVLQPSFEISPVTEISKSVGW